jgi:hypothetical protein
MERLPGVFLVRAEVGSAAASDRPLPVRQQTDIDKKENAMKRAFMRVLGLSLLTSTALVPAALAQDAGAQPQQNRGCDDLQSLIQSNTDQLNPDWVIQANTAIEQNRTASCLRLFEQASTELGLDQQQGDQTQTAQGQQDPLPGQTGRQQPGDETQTAQGQQGQQPGQVGQQQQTESAEIIVTQPEPTVRVQQRSPQIAVTQQRPRVRVDQGQPQIEVRQASPTVHVQMAQPVITIEQPPPEIIVTMPDPRVAVTSAEPQVEVRQPEPRVSVLQPEPRVRVEQEQQTADVQVEQAQPTVQLTQPQQDAEVAVNRAQPQVTFRAADPTVDFQLTGEPEVRFSQTGEPKITFRRAGEAETAEAGQELPEDQQQQTAQAQPGQQLPEDQQQQTAQAQPDQQLPEDQQQQTAQAQPGQELPDEQEQQTAQLDQPQQMQNEMATGSIGEEVDVVALLTAGAGQQIAMGEPQDVSPQDLIGKRLVNADGVELGTVEFLVEAEGTQYIVLARDSILSDGQAGVVLPIENIVMEEDRLMLRGLSEQEMAELQNYDDSQAREIEQGTQIQVATR